MKYLVCLFFLFYCFLGLKAQTDKSIMLKTSIGYDYQHNDHGDISSDYEGPAYGEKINDLKISLLAGKKLKSHFYYGLGISYNILTQEINPENDIPELDNSAGYISVSSYVNQIASSNKISPIIYFQYFTRLNDRLYISFDLYSKYDFNVTKTESILYNPNLSTYTYEKSFTSNTEIKRQYLNVGLFPSLRINLYKNFGVDLTFGSMEYRIKTADSRQNIDKNTKEFNLGFKPENWTIGFYLQI